MNQLRNLIAVMSLIGWALPAVAAGGKLSDPHPVKRTFFVAGTVAEADVPKIGAALRKLPSVTDVAELTPTSGYVRIAYDSHVISDHLVAQTIMNGTTGTRVTMRFHVPEYSKNTEKLDPFFAGLVKAWPIRIEPFDKAAGIFSLTFLPVQIDPKADPHKIGFVQGYLYHPIADNRPGKEGMGLKWLRIEAPMSGQPARTAKRGSPEAAKARPANARSADKLAVATSVDPTIPKVPTFQHDVRPVFEAKCQKCHGAEKQKADLDLRTLASLMKAVRKARQLCRANQRRACSGGRSSNRKCRRRRKSNSPSAKNS